MPRVIKHPSVRQEELLESARALFFERGFDATSVDDVIQRAGLSKGAFYHYFASKDALLEALATKMAAESLAQTADLLEDPTLNAFERLTAFLARGRQLKVEQAPQMLRMFEAVFRPENIALYHRLHAAVRQIMTPVLARIIEQGIEEATFRPSHPRTTAEILLQLATITHDVVARLLTATGADIPPAIEAFERRLVEQGIAVDRILGLPDGSVQFIEPGFTQAMLADRRQEMQPA
jgi:AcrR family transcriptional regulator